MTNHVHLQIETIQHHPMEIMKFINSRYAIYFNKRYHFVGHVFQGRYGAELIKSINSQVEVSRYIHLNPVKATMVKSPEDYPWSSYSAYTTDSANPHVTTEKLLSYFQNPQKEYYRKFVEKGACPPLC